MDVRLTDEQRLLVDATTRFIQSARPLSQVRARIPAVPCDGDYLRRAADLGWFGFLVPEALGGGALSDNPMVDAALVARARGAGLQPGPVIGMTVVALALSVDGTVDQRTSVLSDLLSGQASATWAVAAPAAAAAPSSGVVARRTPRGWRLSGTKTAVQDAQSSEWILVTAACEGGTAQFLLPSRSKGIVMSELESLDVTRRFNELHFDLEVGEEAVVGVPGQSDALVERQWQAACVLTAAETVGAMHADFSLALDYAKQRIAFGRPIGSFQAIKHLLADTSLLLEMSDALVFAAARAVGFATSDSGRVVSIAKAFVGDSGVELVHNCFQVFGGIGYTWDHDQHLYLRRVTSDAALFGSASAHRDRLCVLTGL